MKYILTLFILFVSCKSTDSFKGIPNSYSDIHSVINIEKGCYQINWLHYHKDSNYTLYTAYNTTDWIYVKSISVSDRKSLYIVNHCNNLTSPFFYYKLVRYNDDNYIESNLYKVRNTKY